MSPEIEENIVHRRPIEASRWDQTDFRYMRRRRGTRADHNGDPLDGIVNLFDVAIVLAVAFLVAALTGIGLSDLLSSRNMTIVKDPGQPNMQVITVNGTTITKLNLLAGPAVSGSGTLVGELWRLADGTTVYVPSGAATPAPAVTTTLTPTGVPTTVATPTPAGLTPTPAITPTQTVAPPTGAPGTTPLPGD